MQNERQQAYENVHELVSNEQRRQKEIHDKNIKELNVKQLEKVWLRNFVIEKETIEEISQTMDRTVLSC